MNVNKAIPSFFNGVSQQPAPLRHTSQSEAMVNAYPSIATGLRKRPPTQHIAKLATTVSSDAAVHFINRDAAERYVVIIENGAMRVWSLADGTSRTLNTPSGLGYLSLTSPRDQIAAATVADHTFIVNKTKVVAMDGATTSGSLTGTVQKFSDLPGAPSTGDIYKVQGDPSNTTAVYYVEWDGSVWVESTAPGITYQMNDSTLPWRLVRNSGGDFTLDLIPWDNRLVGDDSSNPVPSLVGGTINDIFFLRNRLGMLSGENIVMSRTGKFYNVWIESAAQQLDSDPIDTTSSHSTVSVFTHAVPFNKSLMLTSGKTQFQFGSDSVLTPKTARVDVVTEFESTALCRPAAAGQDVFFAVDRGNYTGIREYFVDENTVTNDAADITAHVPSFIPKNVFRMAVSTNEDVLALLSLNERNSLWAYKYYWGAEQKEQSAWFKWTFDAGDTILGAEFIDTVLYLVIKRADGTYLEKMDLQVSLSDLTLSIGGVSKDLLIHLDRKTTATGSYNSGTDTTTWTIPYPESAAMQVVCGASFGALAGSALTTAQPTSTTITASGDFSAGACYLGRSYTKRLTLSEQFMRDEKNNAIDSGRLQLRNMTVLYDNTGYFRAEVTPKARDKSTYVMSGKILGDASLVLGGPQIVDGHFRFSIQSNSKQVLIELVNDSYLPSNILSAEWEGTFVLRSRRV